MIGHSRTPYFVVHSKTLSKPRPRPSFSVLGFFYSSWQAQRYRDLLYPLLHPNAHRLVTSGSYMKQLPRCLLIVQRWTRILQVPKHASFLLIHGMYLQSIPILTYIPSMLREGIPCWPHQSVHANATYPAIVKPYRATFEPICRFRRHFRRHWALRPTVPSDYCV